MSTQRVAPRELQPGDVVRGDHMLYATDSSRVTDSGTWHTVATVEALDRGARRITFTDGHYVTSRPNARWDRRAR